MPRTDLSRTLTAALGLSMVALALPIGAQAQGVPFQLVAELNSNTQVIANGSSVNLGSDSVNKPVQLILHIMYVGAGSATVRTAQLIGSPAFTVDGPGLFGALRSGQSTTVTITFTPTSFSQVSAQLNIPYSEFNADGAATSSGFISASLTGTAANFILSYAVPPLSNTVPVADGGTIQFASTQTGSTSTAVLSITNNGSAAGTLEGVTVSGSSFQTQNLPLFPGSIGAGQTLPITLQYKPTAGQADKGSIQLIFPSQTVTVNLAGAAPLLKYQITTAGHASTITPDQPGSIPDTSVGSTATSTLTMTNTGNADAIVNAISVTGAGFQITDAPALPLDIPPNGSATVTFTFSPAQAGTVTGRLRIGADNLVISAKSLGALYQYSYVVGSTAQPVAPNGTVFLAASQIGQASGTTFTVTNTGTVPGTISSLFIGEANSPFTLTNPPALPLTIAPGQSSSFNITFTPSLTTASNGTLHLDAAVFNLSGSGTTPPPLPDYTFTGPSGNIAPMQQPAIGLTLAAPYSVDLQGTLTLSAVPDGFNADPAIQFATGGKTVAFTVPANTTSAIFPSGGNSIRLQTGSTSGTISVVPSFQTSGGVTLKPANPIALQFSVPRVSAILLGAQITNSTPTSMTVAVTGVSNSQTLNHLDFTFTPQSNYNLKNTTSTVQLSNVASAWFQSAAAQQFGGQFIVTIVFTLSSDSTSLTTPLSALKTISVTATNDQGTSSPVTISLQ
jgi:hypothetical protein